MEAIAIFVGCTILLAILCYRFGRQYGYDVGYEDGVHNIISDLKNRKIISIVGKNIFAYSNTTLDK